jgi:hypothetical protein
MRPTSPGQLQFDRDRHPWPVRSSTRLKGAIANFPYPTKSTFDEHEEHSVAPASIDIEKANRNSQEEDSDNLATTPLLPP